MTDDIVYDCPEKFGLAVVKAINDPADSYDFDMVVLWKHKDGRLFWGHDSGCSCPTPFEWAHELSNLNVLTDDSWKDFEEVVNEVWCQYVSEYFADIAQVRRTEMLSAAAQELRAVRGD